MSAHRVGRWARLIAVAIATLAPALLEAGEIPQWPHEQQARLREVEDQVLDVQRKLFAARQQGDASNLAALNKEFRELQQERHELIRITRDQLPSE